MSNTTRLKAKRTVWQEEHDNVLKERFHTDYIHEIASHLCCAVSTVSRHARLLGLRKENRSGRNHDARALVEAAVLSSDWNREQTSRWGATSVRYDCVGISSVTAI